MSANRIYKLYSKYLVEIPSQSEPGFGEIWEAVGNLDDIDSLTRFKITIDGEPPRSGASFFADFETAEKKLIIELRVL